MKKCLILLFSLVFVTLLLSCAKEHKEGLLWKISGNGLNAPSYLFGTGHGRGFYSGCSMLDSVPGFFEALRNTDQYIGESNSALSHGWAQGMLPADSTYDKLLNKEDLALLDSALLKVAGCTSEKYPFVPELVIKIIGDHVHYELTKETNLEGSQTITSVSMDACLQRLARQRGYDIVGLDNLIEFNYLVLLREGSIKDVTDSLVSMLKDGSFVKDFEISKIDSLSVRLLDAYNKQDLKELEIILNQKWERYDVQYEEKVKKNPQRKHILHEISTVRNHKWMKYIPNLINKKASFIAVGVGHLPGEDGLINLLRKEGYKVDPVN